MLVFAEHVPDRERAAKLEARLAPHLSQLTYFRARADDSTYGVTPLHLAPHPASPWQVLFDEGVVAAHLDRLVRDQQPDGGWPITWKPPGAAATLEYRGVETLRALRVLSAYGRL